MSIAAAATSWVVSPPAMASEVRPEIAFTFDDPKTREGANLRWLDLNDRMLSALAKHKIRSILFVCGMRVDSGAGEELIAAWDRRGHLIGNHSYSHPIDASDWAINALPAGESLVWALAKETGRFESELRYPGEDDVYENPKMDALGL